MSSLPKPYYQTKAVTLYHGDCREILPLLKGHAVITDPPYCSGGFTESAKRAARGMGLKHETLKRVGWFAGDNMTAIGISWLMSLVAGWSYRAIPEGGTVSAFCDWRMIPHLAPAIESAGLRWQQLIAWKKPSAGLGTGFRSQHEMILHFSKGTPCYHATHGNVIDAPRVHASKRRHQTQKPVILLETLLEVTTKRGQVVIDPFAGSSSLLVEDRRLERRAVGVELDRNNCDQAVAWIEAA